MKIKRLALAIVIGFFCFYPLFSQSFYRVLEVRDPRMNGPDVSALQNRLLNLNFSELGRADGYYGPVNENVIKNIQKSIGMVVTGKVDKVLWNIIFDDNNSKLLRNIGQANAMNNLEADYYITSAGKRWNIIQLGGYPANGIIHNTGGDSINVRSAPGIKNSVLYSVRGGFTVQWTSYTIELDNISGISERWYRIIFNDQPGWIFGRYLNRMYND